VSVEAYFIVISSHVEKCFGLFGRRSDVVAELFVSSQVDTVVAEVEHVRRAERRLLALDVVPTIVRPSSDAPGPQLGERQHVWLIARSRDCDDYEDRVPEFLVPALDRLHSKSRPYISAVLWLPSPSFAEHAKLFSEFRRVVCWLGPVRKREDIFDHCLASTDVFMIDSTDLHGIFCVTTTK
jgi:hypothetical protein